MIQKGDAMPNRIHHSDIQTLLKQTPKPSVTIYMDTSGKDYADIREEFLNLIAGARRDLNHTPLTIRNAILSPLYRLAHDASWWREMDNGVALFANEETLYAEHFPDSFKTEVTVDEVFHLVPLMQNMNQYGRFYILALGTSARLYVSNHMQIHDMDLPGLMYEKGIDPETVVSLRKVRSKGELNRRLQELETTITGLLHDSNSPLVIAGLPWRVSRYKKIDSYGLTQERVIRKNPDTLTKKALRDQARKILQPFFTQWEEEAQKEFTLLKSQSPRKVVTGLRDVLVALQQGRVQTLFIDSQRHIWGKLQDKYIEVHPKKQDGDHELINDAVLGALSTDKPIYRLDSFVSKEPIAAIVA